MANPFTLNHLPRKNTLGLDHGPPADRAHVASLLLWVAASPQIIDIIRPSSAQMARYEDRFSGEQTGQAKFLNGRASLS